VQRPEHESLREGVLYAVGERYISSLARQFQYAEGEDPRQALMRETRRLVLHLATNPAYVKLSLVDLGHPGGVDILNFPAAHGHDAFGHHLHRASYKV